MIPASTPTGHPGDWRRQLREAFRLPADLIQHLGLPDSALDFDLDPAFPLLVPRAFVARMRRSDASDPLLLQVLPRRVEGRKITGFGLDAVGDLASLRGGGLLQKYAHRLLLVSTGACPVHCRYCFRRHFPYAGEQASRDHWHEAIELLRADPSLHELILSGGDPLSLATSKLAALTEALRELPHLQRLRIHSRWPLMLPARVDEELLHWLGALPWPTVLVLHCNHPQEIDAEVAAACARLRAAGVQLLNQAVLLRGINDQIEVQQALSEGLHAIGVLPYYLHLLDRVEGAAHFAVGERRARAIIAALRERLPGYLVPRLAREEAGAASKRVLA